jgi:hypothetical protein
MDQGLMDVAAKRTAGPYVLLLFFSSACPGVGGLLPVSLIRHTSEGKRPAKGLVARLVKARKKHSITASCRNCVAAQHG